MHPHDWENGMDKYWIALLLAITATQIYAGEKEYTLRYCDDLAKKLQDCTKCKKQNAKTIFKISKELKSVMETTIDLDLGADSKSSIDNNCKIFDKNTFECKTENNTQTNMLTVSNGKFEIKYMLANGEIIEYVCGYETKNIFNFFK